MSPHGITTLLLLQLACVPGGEAAMNWIVQNWYTGSSCGTADATGWFFPVDTATWISLGGGCGSTCSSKMTCSSTEAVYEFYTDAQATTALSETVTVESPELGCNDTKNTETTAFLKKSISCTESAEVAIAMLFSDSSCTDANFVGFKYFPLDKCSREADDRHEKAKCDASDTKKLAIPFFSDSTCGNSSSTYTDGSMTTDSCVADPLDENVAKSTVNYTASQYIKLYTGCGTTGTLPAGVTEPSTDNGATAGQVSGARGQELALGSLALLAAAIMPAFE